MGLINDAQAAFADIYDKDLWGLASGEWSAPRPGEEPEADRQARFVDLIHTIIRLNNVKSVVEFGCGFWSYAKDVNWSGVRYDGFDVVEGVVSSNTEAHGSPNIRFHQVVEGVMLPSADLLISKDVLQHLPTSHVKHYLDLFKKNFKFMLIGNDIVPSDNLNGDTLPGGYRALRLELPPFNEPNIVVQTWISTDFGVRTVKNFCLFVNTPDPPVGGLALKDLPLAARQNDQVVPGRSRLRRRVRDLVVKVPPLARLSGFILKRVRSR